jgi:hypothetical protein
MTRTGIGAPRHRPGNPRRSASADPHGDLARRGYPPAAGMGGAALCPRFHLIRTPLRLIPSRRNLRQSMKLPRCSLKACISSEVEGTISMSPIAPPVGCATRTAKPPRETCAPLPAESRPASAFRKRRQLKRGPQVGQRPGLFLLPPRRQNAISATTSLWRREWDLNPRGAAPQHALQACALDRSAIPPSVRKHSGAAPARQRSLPPNSCVLGLGEPDRPSGLGQGASRVPEPPDRAPRSGTLRFEQRELPARCRPARSPALRPAGRRGLERKL